MTFQTFMVSSKLFGGYNIRLHINDIESIEGVIDKLVQSMHDDLGRLNLYELQVELSKLKFHYHDYTLLDVLTSQVGATWYVCDSC